jgi:hypothetical protein
VEEMTPEQWDKVLSTNLTGTFLFCQAVGKQMAAQGSGKIINIAAVAGLGGASAELQAIGYHASKGGVIAFTNGRTIVHSKWLSWIILSLSSWSAVGLRNISERRSLWTGLERSRLARTESGER